MAPAPQARVLLTIAAMLQTSVLAPHFAPKITSGERYCLVWMSFVKWWLTQHALPRSAILTLMMSLAWVSSAALRLLLPVAVFGVTSPAGVVAAEALVEALADAFVLPDLLSRLMLEISLVSMSL